jgi:predicted adenine nucleotide alpha hydrolase (AANH) superfamily ATPase
LFYNPNIHPLIEFRRREKAVRVYLERDPFPAEIVSEYGLRPFLGRLAVAGWPLDDRKKRCTECYRLRLEKTAETARSRNLAAISTTLLASREQDRNLVADVGREAAARFGVTFAEADLRLAEPEERSLRGIYRQQYCGCIFSEEERHRNDGKHRYKGNGIPHDGRIVRHQCFTKSESLSETLRGAPPIRPASASGEMNSPSASDADSGANGLRYP